MTAPARNAETNAATPPRGVLVGIGVGPGDPDAVTLQAVKALHHADRVVAPTLAPDAVGRAESIVRQVAPGVYFRYSAISATDKTVAFGGSNNVWIVFEDYVVVIDAIRRSLDEKRPIELGG